MPPPGSPTVRLVRAVFVGLWAVVGAVVAHASQGGSAPPVVALAPVAVSVVVVVWRVGSRRLHFAAAFLLLLVSQLTVHALSSYIHGHVMSPSPSMLSGHVVAVAVVAAGIAAVDKLWWSWWDRVAMIVRVHPWTPVVATAPVPFVQRTPGHPVALAHVVVRRGPPVS